MCVLSGKATLCVLSGETTVCVLPEEATLCVLSGEAILCILSGEAILPFSILFPFSTGISRMKLFPLRVDLMLEGCAVHTERNN